MVLNSIGVYGFLIRADLEHPLAGGLTVARARVGGERKAVEADLGPVRYLAALIGTTDEVAMRYFILVVALLLDPAAVLLLLAHVWCGATSKQIS
jgi:hypothetical protein